MLIAFCLFLSLKYVKFLFLVKSILFTFPGLEEKLEFCTLIPYFSGICNLMQCTARRYAKTCKRRQIPPKAVQIQSLKSNIMVSGNEECGQEKKLQTKQQSCKKVCQPIGRGQGKDV